MTKAEVERIKTDVCALRVEIKLCTALETMVEALAEAIDERGEGPNTHKARQLLREWNGE